ncbi:MAG: 4a-hydroxytetrahydrobiopterin dehydratase [Acidimicrobiales bacterium]
MPEPLDDAAVDAALAELDGWERDGAAIHKQFRFSDFKEAFGFMAHMALVSEKADHHPDWANTYNTVTVDLSSHDAGGITQRDLDWAAAADAAVS